ncbi:CYTH domain-containing protein [Butyrivibrio sp. MB2005]|uniref:CYTH domain-containing protein n=1 Tax=Butyrivibrio sp. MB2005 TaxID=1280678 RepID=UPI00041082F2|nr:CYTH domain-containing protein [Butyrivibrio sp. MB2005]
MGVEIERKFTVKELPKDLEQYPVHIIEQGYLSVVPAIRVRREDERFYMTYKSHKDFGKADGGSSVSGDIGKTEYNLPLDKDSYEHLVAKADGNVISKKRYIIPINKDAFDSSDDKLQKVMDSLKIELDVFEGKFEGRILAEVEFPDEETAAAYKPADWFDEDVTGDVRYSNAHMSTE